MNIGWLKPKNKEKNEITYKNPFNEFHARVNELFNDFWGNKDFSLKQVNFSPKVDVTEDDKSINIKAELPGLEEKEVEVLYQDNTLTIKGEKKQESESKDKGCYHKEISYGSFERSFTLPENIVEENIQAKFTKGVLNIEIPKDPKKETKKNIIKIDVK